MLVRHSDVLAQLCQRSLDPSASEESPKVEESPFGQKVT
jgi:hypothetical protein